jgi:hypothetical protein
MDPGGQHLSGGKLGLRQQCQMQLVLLRGEALRQLSHHPLSATAAEMRNHQKKLGRQIHNLWKTSEVAVSISNNQIIICNL